MAVFTQQGSNTSRIEVTDGKYYETPHESPLWFDGITPTPFEYAMKLMRESGDYACEHGPWRDTELKGIRVRARIVTCIDIRSFVSLFWPTGNYSYDEMQDQRTRQLARQLALFGTVHIQEDDGYATRLFVEH